MLEEMAEEVHLRLLIDHLRRYHILPRVVLRPRPLNMFLQAWVEQDPGTTWS